MRNKINIALSIFTSLLICVIFFPVRITGGSMNANYIGVTNIFNYYFSHENMCTDCFNYDVVIWIVILEIIGVFAISMFILNFIDKRRRQF